MNAADPAPVAIFLTIPGRAVEAAALYTAALPGARETGRMAPPGRERPLTIAFEWRGQAFMLLDDGPEAAFTDSVSIAVTTGDQAETDALWNALIADGGAPIACGWLKDRFGLRWQVTPRRLVELMCDPDPARAGRTMAAMGQMVKIDIAALEAAAAGE